MSSHFKKNFIRLVNILIAFWSINHKQNSYWVRTKVVEIKIRLSNSHNINFSCCCGHCCCSPSHVRSHCKTLVKTTTLCIVKIKCRWDSARSVNTLSIFPSSSHSFPIQINTNHNHHQYIKYVLYYNFR